MQIFSADYIFPVSTPPVRNGFVAVDNSGNIIEVTDTNSWKGRVEAFRGIIVPGFVNAHCHIEHSCLKGKIKERTGLTGFIRQLKNVNQKQSKEDIFEAVSNADAEMFSNGIVVIGDISNGNHSFITKSKSKIYYHTFLEVFNVMPELAEAEFEKAISLEQELLNNHLAYSTTAHAHYSVSEKLFQLISENAVKNNFILSIHNQESESENEMFSGKTGMMIEFMESIGISMEHFKPSGKSSLQSCLRFLPMQNKLLLVHNTFSNKSDIRFAHEYSENIYWCFCPNANLFIENKLPDFKIFIQENAKCCIGTDSYASNGSLSILGELKTISIHSPGIPLQKLIEWATINGAEFFGIEKTYGSFEKGKRPGINLIENADLENLKLTEESSVKKLI